jgi:hypothetical protein
VAIRFLLACRRFAEHHLGEGSSHRIGQYDSVFWLEQVRIDEPVAAFENARETDSPEMPLP